MYINYQAIKLAKHFPAFIRTLATDVVEQGYISPGDFFQGLNSYDLESLSRIVENDVLAHELNAPYLGTEQDVDGQVITLLTLMLAAAEGVNVQELEIEKDEQTLLKMYKATCIFTSIESLKRKGFVDVNYNAFTYDLSCNEEIVRMKEQPSGNQFWYSSGMSYTEFKKVQYNKSLKIGLPPVGEYK